MATRTSGRANSLLESLFELLETVETSITTNIGENRASEDEQLAHLREAYRREDLVLVLGAGASMAHGLPAWDALLKKLLVSTFQTPGEELAHDAAYLASQLLAVFNLSPLVVGRMLRQHYLGTDLRHRGNLHFEQAIRDAIYERGPSRLDNRLFKEITRLCVAPGKSPSLDSIITYNYDDLVERYLDQVDLDVPYETIHAIGMNPSPGNLPIYHVHGYLPHEGRISDRHGVVLSEDMYHLHYLDTYSWANMVQINKFKDKVCLFVGLSLTDPNMRRLLDIANTQRGTSGQRGKSALRHVIVRRRFQLQDVQRRLTSDLEEIVRGSGAHASGNGAKTEDTQADTAARLISTMHGLQERDDNSFGSHTYWIDEFDDIVTLLSGIRKLPPQQVP
jgi:hypothetical protein